MFRVVTTIEANEAVSSDFLKKKINRGREGKENDRKPSSASLKIPKGYT